LRILVVARRYHLAIAGFVASLVAVLVDGEIHKSSIIVVWSMLRALRSSFLPNWPDPRLPSWTARLVPVVVLMLSSAYKLPTWMFDRKMMNPTHIKFLDYHGGKSRKQLEPFVVGIDSPCPHVIHPGQTCVEHSATFWIDSFKRAFKALLPVYGAAILFAKERRWMSFLFNLLRSSAFLSTYCASAWMWACIFYRFRRPATLASSSFIFSRHLCRSSPNSVPPPTLDVCFHSSLTGLSCLIERPNRSIEMAWYEVTYVLDSLYIRAVAADIIKPNAFINMLVLALSVATLLHHHRHQPAFLMNWLLKVSI
jgi:hypothetical protein